MSRLVVEGLSKRFATGNGSEVSAVRNVSFAVGPGECLALVGPSGCGKTTTLRLIAGLETPDAGSIRLGERDLTRADPAARSVALVFQSLALLPHLTARDNIALPLRLAGRSANEIAGAVDALADRLGLESCLAQFPENLSGGERQRTAVARALIQDPKVLLLDEPLASLDAPRRAELRLLLRQLRHERQLAVVHVTHDQSEALALGDNIAVMRDGCFEQVGDPATVYERPANRFVAGFLGMPPMNFLQGRLEAGHFQIGNQRVRLPVKLTHGRSDGPVTLGLRPEAVTLQESVGDALQFVPTAWEFAGLDWVGYGNVEGQSFAVRMPRKAAPSGTLRILPDWDRARLIE